MSFTSTAAASTVAMAATSGTVTVRELPLPTWAYGAIALACFFALLAVLWSFRNTAARYDQPAGSDHGDPLGSRGSRRATDHGADH